MFTEHEPIVGVPVAEIRREHFTIESALAELQKADKDERSARVRKGEIFANAREILPLAQYERLVKESGYAASTVRVYIALFQNPEFRARQHVTDTDNHATRVASGAHKIRAQKHRRAMEALRQACIAPSAAECQRIVKEFGNEFL